MPRKISRKGLKRRADKIFSAWIRSEGYCEWCGDVNDTLQCAHIFSRRYMSTRYDYNNAVCLCASCHFKAHAQPIEFAEFVKRYLGNKGYADLRRKAKTSIKKVDLQAIIEKYTNLLKEQTQ